MVPGTTGNAARAVPVGVQSACYGSGLSKNNVLADAGRREFNWDRLRAGAAARSPVGPNPTQVRHRSAYRPSRYQTFSMTGDQRLCAHGGRSRPPHRHSRAGTRPGMAVAAQASAASEEWALEKNFDSRFAPTKERPGDDTRKPSQPFQTGALPQYFIRSRVGIFCSARRNDQKAHIEPMMIFRHGGYRRGRCSPPACRHFARHRIALQSAEIGLTIH
jgi:hypothetical protein